MKDIKKKTKLPSFKLIIFYLLILTLPSFLDFSLNNIFDLSKLTLLSIGLIFILSLTFINWSYFSKISFYRSKIDFIIFLFILITTLSCIFSSTSFTHSFLGSYRTQEGLFALFNYIIVFYLILSFISIKSEGRIFSIATIILLSGLLPSIYGIVQHFGKDPFSWSWFSRTTPTSTFGNPNFTSSYVTTLIPLGICLYLVSKKAKFIFLLVTLCCYLCFIYTKTRATFLGLSVSLFIIFIISIIWSVKKKLRLSIIPSGLIMMLLLVFTYGFYEIKGKGGTALSRFSEVKDILKRADSLPISEALTKRGSIGFRLALWRDTLHMVQDSPLFGIGQGSMLTLYPKYRSLDVIQLEGGQYCRVDHVHCDILEALLNWGFLGFFFYLLILGIILYWGFYSAIYESNFVKLGLVSSLLTYIVQNLFSFSIVATSFLFWLLLGTTMGIAGKTKLVEKKISSTQRFIFIFLTLSLLLLLFPIVKRYIADRKFKLGKLAEEAHYIDYAILYYKEAIDLNPYEKNYYESLVDVYLRAVQEGKVTPGKRDSYINESINLAKKAIKLARCDSILYNLLGSAYFLRGDKKRALHYFKKAQLWEPYFIDAHNNEGMVYISLQDYKKAKEAFKRILRFDPKVAQAWYFWGYSAYKAGFKEEAKYALSKFIKLFPNDLRIPKAKDILNLTSTPF